MVFRTRRSNAEAAGHLGYPQSSLTDTVINEVVWYMRENGIQRSHLADKMNVSPGRVSQILSGGENLTLKTLDAVVVALGARLEVQMHPWTDRVPPAPPAPPGLA
ncbi:helix-turn-helix domain-containing protein [Actinomadura macra]|uniref:helix-turn-helix domain-containing protein n=1 Tax=Actinomadura macra TaxID=46164 RepID=UPI00083119BD|nr:helix-turn-helix transcriptional regulator [Actinomadura macra]